MTIKNLQVAEVLLIKRLLEEKLVEIENYSKRKDKQNCVIEVHQFTKEQANSILNKL